MKSYQVIVGNIGTVYSGAQRAELRGMLQEY
jgi:hypothetical protein